MKDQVCNSTSGYLSKETQNTNLKRHMHPYVHCNIICNNQDMEETQMSINRWVDKEELVHLYKEYDSATENNEILLSATTWMDLSGIVLS